MQQIETFKIGYSFNPIVRLIGFIAVILTPLLCIESLLIGTSSLVIGVFFAFTSYGTQINYIKKTYREYGRFFFLKFGTWNSVQSFPYLCVFKHKMGSRIYSSSSHSTNISSSQYEICMLNETHRKRILLNLHDSMEEAKIDAQRLEKQSDFFILTTFNPKRF
jgi:hypothetical protein